MESEVPTDRSVHVELRVEVPWARVEEGLNAGFGRLQRTAKSRLPAREGPAQRRSPALRPPGARRGGGRPRRGASRLGRPEHEAGRGGEPRDGCPPLHREGRTPRVLCPPRGPAEGGVPRSRGSHGRAPRRRRERRRRGGRARAAPRPARRDRGAGAYAPGPRG